MMIPTHCFKSKKILLFPAIILIREKMMSAIKNSKAAIGKTNLLINGSSNKIIVSNIKYDTLNSKNGIFA